jgi:outer membrane cobalamin receptor
MLSKRLYSLSLSFLGLLYHEGACQEAETLLLQPLSLERVVIRGQARQQPTTLPSWQLARVVNNQVKTSSQVQQNKSDPFNINNTFEASAGRHQSWNIFDSILFKRNLTSVSLAYEQNNTEGFREGYQKKQSEFQAEWSQRTSQNLHLKTFYHWTHRDMDLPTLSWGTPKGKTRTETVHDLRLQLESPYDRRHRYKIIYDHLRAQQDNSKEQDYRYQLHRLGFTTKIENWEAALSVEVDKKDSEQTTLARLFFKRSKEIIDDRSALHLGLGAYSLSSRESALDTSGFLALKNNNKNNTLSFSPYVQFDHAFTKKTAFFASYSQFYERIPVLDVFFDQPESARPSNIIQPTFHIEIESGLRWNLNPQWKLGLSHAWHQYKDRPITVIDVLSGEGRLTQEVWERGYDSTTGLELRGRIDEHWHLDLATHYSKSHWDKPNVSFTPFQAKLKWKAHLAYQRKRWQVGTTYLVESGLLSYPVISQLKNRRFLSIEAKWFSWEGFQVHGNIRNALNHESEVSLGYPTPPWDTQLGMRATF